jgi:hypothetical protein
MTSEASVSSKIGRKSPAPRYWIPIGVFGCAFLFLIITMYRFVNPYDEAVILVGSTRVLSGDIPYRDFYANYGPAQFYVLAALFKLFGSLIPLRPGAQNVVAARHARVRTNHEHNYPRWP